MNMNIYVWIAVYAIGAVIGWCLGSSIKKWWNRRKYDKFHEEAENSRKIEDDLRNSMERDGVVTVQVHTALATFEVQVQIAKLLAAVSEGRMTWQQVDAEVNKDEELRHRFQICFK